MNDELPKMFIETIFNGSIIDRLKHLHRMSDTPESLLNSLKQFGYVYLMQEREFINSGRPVYKIGKCDNPNKRGKGYPKESIFIQISLVNYYSECETALKNAFAAVFIHRTNIGSEYFEGDLDMMLLIFEEIVSNYKTYTVLNNVVSFTDAMKTQLLEGGTSASIGSVTKSFKTLFEIWDTIHPVNPKRCKDESLSEIENNGSASPGLLCKLLYEICKIQSTVQSWLRNEWVTLNKKPIPRGDNNKRANLTVEGINKHANNGEGITEIPKGTIYGYKDNVWNPVLNGNIYNPTISDIEWDHLRIKYSNINDNEWNQRRTEIIKILSE